MIHSTTPILRSSRFSASTDRLRGSVNDALRINVTREIYHATSISTPTSVASWGLTNPGIEIRFDTTQTHKQSARRAWRPRRAFLPASQKSRTIWDVILLVTTNTACFVFSSRSSVSGSSAKSAMRLACSSRCSPRGLMPMAIPRPSGQAAKVQHPY
jgi:hypothetical protein